MTEEQLKLIASDFLGGKIHSGLFVTDYPVEDLIQTFQFVSSFPECKMVNCSRSLFLDQRRLMFVTINNIEDCYLHAGRQFNAIYFRSAMLGSREFCYLASRVRGGKGQRNYIELL
jgi:hypothetical protein